MKKRYIDQLAKTDLSDEEQQIFLESLVKAHLDEENRAEWSEQLKRKGIVRNRPVKRYLWRTWAAVAAIAATFTIVIIWQWQNPPSPEALATQYIQREKPLQLPGEFRGDSQNDAAYSAALQAYNAKNYGLAIQHLNKIIPTDTSQEPALLLRALCLFYSGEYSSAIPILIKAKNLGKIADTQANWYLALAYISNGEKELSIPLLQGLSTATESIYKEPSTRLLQAIKQQK